MFLMPEPIPLFPKLVMAGVFTDFALDIDEDGFLTGFLLNDLSAAPSMAICP